jgi:hypothetical protein
MDRKKHMERNVGASWAVWEEYLEKKKNFGTNNGNGDNIREITRADERF